MSSISTMLSVDYKKLVSRADFVFTKPVSRSEAGLPVGNGQMGSLVWTSANALHFQINRVDVFSCNSYTGSFDSSEDYCGGCGFVDIDFGDELFPQEHTLQHLSVYDGLLTIKGDSIKARIFASCQQDVMVVEINDERKQPGPIYVDLRMLRDPVVKRRNHTATSKLIQKESRIILTQEFVEPADNGIREGDHYCASAVAISLVNREGSVQIINNTTIRLLTKPGSGSFVILISSAASMNPEDNVVSMALDNLDRAEVNGLAALLRANQNWWQDFWSKSFVHLDSEDGIADAVEKDYTYYLYVMGCSSRGKYPPKFNGMLWCTGGDIRMWGSQYWWWNEQTLYRTLLAANHLELMNPMFDMYSGMYSAAKLAARQQWGSKGIFIPETVAFNGLERLPEDIAQELRDFLLEKKSSAELSLAFKEYMKYRHHFSSRWNFLHALACGPYSFVVHIFSSGAKIAYLYWLYYEYTLDEFWLRNRAYPVLKGVAEFYRNYPNIEKGKDGKYHIHNVNSHEPLWGAQDTMEELSAMYGIFPLVIKASEILNVDAQMRPIWKEFLENLAPLPTNDHPPDHVPCNRYSSGTRTWAEGLKPYQKIIASEGIPFPRPCVHYDLCTLETKDLEMTKIAQATYESSALHKQILAGHPVSMSILDETPIVASMLGRADDIKVILSWQANQKKTLPNLLVLDEGEQTQTIEGIGVTSYALQLALCQSVPAGPGKDPVIHVFPAWPKEWGAQYTLLCRRGFLITSSIQKGQIEFVEITSQLGKECILRNPWEKETVVLYRNGREGERMSGSLLKFNTCKGEHIVVTPEGSSPMQFQHQVP